MKLTWKPARHPEPWVMAKTCEISTCGSYRLYQNGRTGLWICVYLPDPQGSTSIAVFDSRDAVADWAVAHAAKRAMEKAA